MRSASRLVTCVDAARVHLGQRRVDRRPSRSATAGSNRARNSAIRRAHGVRVGEQDVGHVVRPNGAAELAGVAGVGAQHRDLPPGQPGAQHQRGEPVGLGVAAPGRAERRAELALALVLRVRGQGGRGGLVEAQAEVVEPAAHAVGAGELGRVLVEHLHAELLQHRQHRGQGGRGAGQVERQPALVGGVGRRVEAHVEVARAVERGDPPQVLDGAAGGSTAAL